MDDSPRPEVQVLLGHGALRAGLGCDGAGGVGPTQVWYLLWAGATEEEPSASVAVGEAVAAAEGRATGALGLAVEAAAGEAPAEREARPAVELGATATAALGVEVSARGSGTLAHPRPKGMSPSSLRHCRT